jgi:hypothetical protein
MLMGHENKREWEEKKKKKKNKKKKKKPWFRGQFIHTLCQCVIQQLNLLHCLTGHALQRMKKRLKTRTKPSTNCAKGQNRLDWTRDD